MANVKKETILDAVDSLLGQLQLTTNQAAPEPVKKSKPKRVRARRSKKRGKPKQSTSSSTSQERIQEKSKKVGEKEETMVKDSLPLKTKVRIRQTEVQDSQSKKQAETKIKQTSKPKSDQSKDFSSVNKHDVENVSQSEEYQKDLPSSESNPSVRKESSQSKPIFEGKTLLQTQVNLGVFKQSHTPREATAADCDLSKFEVIESGMMFLCNKMSEHECLDKMLFGSPKSRFKGMERITSNTALFLYRVDRTYPLLHGVFVIDGRPKINIDAEAWGGRFPAQVRVKDFHRFSNPLPEFHMRRIFQGKRLLFQHSRLLKKSETHALIAEFYNNRHKKTHEQVVEFGEMGRPILLPQAFQFPVLPGQPPMSQNHLKMNRWFPTEVSYLPQWQLSPRRRRKGRGRRGGGYYSSTWRGNSYNSYYHQGTAVHESGIVAAWNTNK